MPNFLAPTPSRGRPPPHRAKTGLESLGLRSFFGPDSKGNHRIQLKFTYLSRSESSSHQCPWARSMHRPRKTELSCTFCLGQRSRKFVRSRFLTPNICQNSCILGTGTASTICPETTLQPEILAKLIPNTLFHVAEIMFSKKIIPKTLVHVIL